MADELKLRPAQRIKVQAKIGLTGAASSGKTTAGLMIAYGLCEDWAKIAVISAEPNQSADLYAERFGKYDVLDLTEEGDYSAEQYIKALRVCEDAGKEVVIFDGISQEYHWFLDAAKVAKMGYAEIVPRHEAFWRAALTSKCHVIFTCRKVTDWWIGTDEKGKYSQKKIGTKDVARDGWDYDLIIQLAIDVETHLATPLIDRTELFASVKDGAVPFLVDFETGRAIKKWVNEGLDLDAEKNDAIYNIGKSENGMELGILYDGGSDALHKNQEFLHALKMRAIAVVDLAKTGKELADGYKHLPEYVKDELPLKKAIINKAVELVPNYDNMVDLKAFWEDMCGSGDVVAVLPFVKAEKRVYDAVRAMQNNLVIWANMKNADELAETFKGLVTKAMDADLIQIKSRALELMAQIKTQSALKDFYSTLCGSQVDPPPIPPLRADSEFTDAVKKHKEVVNSLPPEPVVVPPAVDFDEKPKSDSGKVKDESVNRPVKVKFPKKGEVKDKK